MDAVQAALALIVDYVPTLKPEWNLLPQYFPHQVESHHDLADEDSEAFEWCRQMFGLERYVWNEAIPNVDGNATFMIHEFAKWDCYEGVYYFAHLDDALLFKLTWAGRTADEE